MLEPVAQYCRKVAQTQSRLPTSSRIFPKPRNKPIPGSIDTRMQTARLVILKKARARFALAAPI